MISVVMATYNGEKYIMQQLLSIVQQTKTPNEVIIVDDCSTDDTFSIIGDFVKKYHHLEWKIYRNQKNLGWKINFMTAISKAKGDIIFTCDQDDVWNKKKIEIMSYVMDKHKEVNLLVSDFQTNNMIFDNSILNKNYQRMQVKKIKIDDKFMYVRYPGCTYCFRKCFFGEVKQFWFSDYPHDALLWRYAIITESLYYIPIKTIYWRRHKGAATAYKIKTIKEKMEMLRYYNKVLNELLRLDLSKRTVKTCIRYRKYLYYRHKFLQTQNIIYWVCGGYYLSCYYNVRTWIGDLGEMILENV